MGTRRPLLISGRVPLTVQMTTALSGRNGK